MDIVDLREFYSSSLGQAAQKLISQQLMARWPNIRDSRLLGLGYAIPYLDELGRNASHNIAFLPARIGAVAWPENGPNRTALVDEAQLPLADGSIDYVLVIHGLEHTQEASGLLSEVFRILSPQGRALFIVPNRRGLWARFDSTPFGHGQPFSRGQLSGLLRDAQFSPLDWSNFLFMPPINRNFCIRSANLIERLGLALGSGFSGLIMAEAVKQVYALTPDRKARRLMARFRPALQPAPAMRDAQNP